MWIIDASASNRSPTMHQHLTLDILRILTMTGAVECAKLLRLRDGGWVITIDHTGGKRGVGREFCTARGGIRIFKTSDAALGILEEAGYTGRIECVLPEPETEAA